MKFTDMNLTENKETTTLSVGDIKIKVLKYLPIKDKNILIALALQNSEEKNGLYNRIKSMMFFDLYRVYSYSDIEFSDEEKADAIALYDKLKGNGLLDGIIAVIPETERATLNKMYIEHLNVKERYKHSVAGVINSFIEDLAPNAQNAAQIINNFNPEMFQNVLKFAEAANGGRPVK